VVAVVVAVVVVVLRLPIPAKYPTPAPTTRAKIISTEAICPFIASEERLGGPIILLMRTAYHEDGEGGFPD